MLPGDTGWRRSPVEFIGVPAGAVVSDALITLTLQGRTCPDCVPAGYRLRYQPRSVGMAHTDPRAWEVTTTHDVTCPGLWLWQQHTETDDDL